MKRTSQFLMAVAALAVAVGGSAQAALWTGAGDGSSFDDGLNWDGSVVPATAEIAAGPFTVTRNADVSIDRTFVSGGSTLNVTGGTQNDGRSGASIYNFVGNSSAGTVNQSGGDYGIGHALRIGGGDANSDGAYNLSGGSLNVFRGSNSNIIGTVGRPSLQVGNPSTGGSGILEISGGSLVTRFGSHLGDGGVFSVVGSGASSIAIGNNNNGEGHWVQRAGGTLQVAIDAGGLTPIFIDDNGDDGAGIFAEFEAGSLLDVSFDGIAPVSGTWTVLELENNDIEISGMGTATGMTTLGLALSGSTSGGWSFNVDNSGANGLLTVSYIPEPSSLALMMFGGMAAILRRRVV